MELETAKTYRDQWIAALAAASSGKRFTITSDTGSSRSLGYEDLKEIEHMVDFWESKVSEIKARTSAGTDDFAYHQPGVRVARWTR